MILKSEIFGDYEYAEQSVYIFPEGLVRHPDRKRFILIPDTSHIKTASRRMTEEEKEEYRKTLGDNPHADIPTW